MDTRASQSSPLRVARGLGRFPPPKHLGTAPLPLGSSQGQASPGLELHANHIEMIARSRRGPTWERYSQGWVQWTTFAQGRGKPPLPVEPVEFARFLAEARDKNIGYMQAKMRICAAKAFSAISGHPFPEDHPLIKGYRAGARQTKMVIRPKANPIFASDIPHERAPGGLPPPPPS